MIIIGAGMSGLLCGALNPGSIIYEAGPKRESDHKALFRCKNDMIGKILGIPFKEVTVHKSIWLDGKEVNPSPRIGHLYSQKVTGFITGRSILDISSGKRYIAPDNFLDILKSRCKISYNRTVGLPGEGAPWISTIPMNKMAHLVGVQHNPATEFLAEPIHVTRIKIANCDSYCTVYYPSPNTPLYRASLTGNILIIESTSKIKDKDLYEVFTSLGLPHCESNGYETFTQERGKILPVDESLRTDIISRLTLEHNIYSLGRFATWRPKVMLDDVLEDIFIIKKLIEGGNYASMRYSQKG